MAMLCMENMEGDSEWTAVCCDTEHLQESPLAWPHQVLYISTDDLCCSGTQLPAFSFFPEPGLSAAAKSSEGAEGDDGQLYSVTESQHDVLVLFENNKPRFYLE